ncbi:hypothetical protein EP7_001707 [Isosphaeraceae bacterium EP7]
MRQRTTTRAPQIRPWTAAMGLLLALCSSVATTAAADDWVLPDDRLGVATAPILFLSRPDVQEELRLDPNQVEDAKRKIVELYRAATTLKGKTGGELLAGRRSIDGEQKRWLTGHLSREQLARLAQIEIQWEGPSTVIRRPILADSLKLKPEQRQTLEKAVADREAKVRDGAPPRQADHDLAEVVLGTLDVEQKSIWRSMLGTPFEVKPTVAAAAPKAAPARR